MEGLEGWLWLGQGPPVKSSHRDFEDLPVAYLRRDDINCKNGAYVCMQMSGVEAMGEACGERKTQKSEKLADVTCPLPLQNWLYHFGFSYRLQARNCLGLIFFLGS